MPTLQTPDELQPTMQELADARHAIQDAEASKRLLARKRRERKGLRKFDMNTHHSKPGDHTHNTPPLRRDAKFNNKLDLPAYAYKTSAPGICVYIDPDGTVDLRFTLMILAHYRNIIASYKTTPDMQYRKDNPTL